MANTFSQIYIQIVFAVLGRQNFIKESFREELQKYISGIIHHKNQKLYAIDCRPDHAHIFVSMQPDKSISSLVNDIKSNSSSFIKDRFSILNFSWQTGFGAFSYSKSQAPQVVDYIMNQYQHHKKVTFREEYLELLKEFDVQFNSKYLFEFYH
jgi:putative transposase